MKMLSRCILTLVLALGPAASFGVAHGHGCGHGHGAGCQNCQQTGNCKGANCKNGNGKQGQGNPNCGNCGNCPNCANQNAKQGQSTDKIPPPTK